MDYVNGVLLVDPIKMQKDMFNGCGGILALLTGTYIDRHFVHYEINFKSRYLPILTVVGLGLMMGWVALFAPAILTPNLGVQLGNYLTGFVQVLFGVLLWPMFIMEFNKRNNS